MTRRENSEFLREFLDDLVDLTEKNIYCVLIFSIFSQSNLKLEGSMTSIV